MTVKQLKEQIEIALNAGNITEDSEVMVYNEIYDKSVGVINTDDFDLDENRKYRFSINFKSTF